MKEEKRELIDPLEFYEHEEFIPVDEWTPTKEEMIFTTTKGAIIADVSGYFGDSHQSASNTFVMSPKRSYNSVAMREHITLYLNYFERFYDRDHQLFSTYCRIKYMIDHEEGYTKSMFFFDLMKYIIRGPIEMKTMNMNAANYCLSLNYKSRTSSSLQYNDEHAMLMMKISVQINQIIPLLCHFMYSRKIQNTSDFLFEIYDKVIDGYDIDIYSKLYETAYSNVIRSVKQNPIIWGKQSIRGNDPITHAMQSVQNILINIICKYVYNGNLIHLEFRAA